MKLAEMFPSNYLKKEDVPQPVTVTIKDVVQEEMPGDKELKAVARFTGTTKPMILNKGNASLLAEIYGDDSDAWHGKQVEIYHDPGVMYGGKRVGGLRLRMPSQNGAAPARSAPNPAPTPAQFQKPTHWDVSDGQNVIKNQTTAQVSAWLSASKLRAQDVRVKPVGTADIRTADLWGFKSSEDDGDPIPF